MVPVVHIVGTPSTVSQQNGAVLHHTLGNGDFEVFLRMFKEITVAHTALTVENAEKEIDRVLQKCISSKRPVYIAIPTDVSRVKIEVNMKPLLKHYMESDSEIMKDALAHVLEKLNSASNPAIIVDACAQRFHVEEELLDFVNTSGYPVYAAPMGKGIVSEFHPHFRGSFVGELSLPAVKEELEAADQIVLIRSIKRYSFQGDESMLPEFYSEDAFITVISTLAASHSTSRPRVSLNFTPPIPRSTTPSTSKSGSAISSLC